MSPFSSKTPPNIWTGQSLHFGGLVTLSILVVYLWISIGRPQTIAFWIAFLVPVLHQIFVWITWRLELRTHAISNIMGLNGFVFIFFILFGSRFISIGFLAWLDQGSLEMPLTPRVFSTFVLLAISLYAIFSVHKYFGLARAAGADHFEERYRDMPLVKKGIFQFTSNGMYVYAFLFFWAISFGFNSRAALIIAGFSHLYIWIHYFSTEKPDMDYLYNYGTQNQ